MTGPCAKRTVTCTIIAADGERFVGRNDCDNPQPVCPRMPGEDYAKCVTVCAVQGHAEVVTLRMAGEKARGGHAYVEGHTYACQSCQEALFGAGVAALTIGAPHSPDEDWRESFRLVAEGMLIPFEMELPPRRRDVFCPVRRSTVSSQVDRCGGTVCPFPLSEKPNDPA